MTIVKEEDLSPESPLTLTILSTEPNNFYYYENTLTTMSATDSSTNSNTPTIEELTSAYLPSESELLVLESEGRFLDRETVSRTMSLTYSDFMYSHPHPPRPQQQVQAQQTVPVTMDEDETDLGLGNLRAAHHYNQNVHSASSWSLSLTGGILGSSSSQLPNEFQVIQETVVPLLQNLDESDQDFLLIAEFSELEGPIPICTVPNNAPIKTDIILNNLAVHLMSTDYQVNTVGVFGICEDTQVLRTNVLNGVHVFMQYFTLYDIKARGFVRPFCFGYISKDHIKLEKCMDKLVKQFTEITEIIKHTNRVWFADELSQYLIKLKEAKDNFLARAAQPPEDSGDDEDITFVLENSDDSDSITLNQIAHQYTEIENIYKIIMNAKVDPLCIKAVEELDNFLSVESTTLENLLNKLDFSGNTFDLLDIPLVHPLKQKGESLRPLTTLAQAGVIALVVELMTIYTEQRSDIIFSEMTQLTMDFRDHFEISKSNLPIASGEPKNLNLNLANTEEFSKIIEKIRTSVPIPPPDNRSGSYHSLSDESDIVIPNQDGGIDIEFGANCSYVTACGSIESNIVDPAMLQAASSKILSTTVQTTSSSYSLSPPTRLNAFNDPELLEDLGLTSSWTLIESKDPRGSQSSEDDGSPLKNIEDSNPIEIQKVPWWTSVSKTNLQKNDPGYALLKFFRHYFKVAHHVLFSILIGRPIIFSGSCKYRRKIIQIINSFILLVPCFPKTSFQVLHWHQGILVKAHFENKLIGLCIPERHDIHDLLNPRELTGVTVLDVENKKILGPAYSGSYLKPFEDLTCQKYFFDDLSLISYIGSILAEIETQVYMCKSFQLDGKDTKSTIMKRLDLKNSDAEIVKYLSSLIQLSEQASELF